MIEQSPVEILCEWAWTKVNLERLQRAHLGGGSSPEIEAAIVAYRHALRKKKALDFANRDHHVALALAESQC